MKNQDAYTDYHLNAVDDFRLINWARREQSRYVAQLLRTAAGAVKKAVARVLTGLRYSGSLNRLNSLNDRLLEDVGLTRETVLDRMVEAHRATKVAGNDERAQQRRDVA